MIESNEEAFGAYYDTATNTLYVRTAILNDPKSNLFLVMIHELNGGTHTRTKGPKIAIAVNLTYRGA